MEHPDFWTLSYQILDDVTEPGDCYSHKHLDGSRCALEACYVACMVGKWLGEWANRTHADVAWRPVEAELNKLRFPLG